MRGAFTGAHWDWSTHCSSIQHPLGHWLLDVEQPLGFTKFVDMVGNVILFSRFVVFRFDMSSGRSRVSVLGNENFCVAVGARLYGR